MVKIPWHLVGEVRLPPRRSAAEVKGRQLRSFRADLDAGEALGEAAAGLTDRTPAPPPPRSTPSPSGLIGAYANLAVGHVCPSWHACRQLRVGLALDAQAPLPKVFAADRHDRTSVDLAHHRGDLLNRLASGCCRRGSIRRKSEVSATSFEAAAVEEFGRARAAVRVLRVHDRTNDIEEHDHDDEQVEHEDDPIYGRVEDVGVELLGEGQQQHGVERLQQRVERVI